MLLKGRRQETKGRMAEESARRRNGEQTSLFLYLGARVSPSRHRPSDYERNQIWLMIIFKFQVLEADHMASLPAHFSWIFHRSDQPHFARPQLY